MNKLLDYKSFLLGIVVYWMLATVWSTLYPFFFALETILNPIAVVVAKSLLALVVVYLLFRNPKIPNIRWIHVAMLVAFIMLMVLLDYVLLDRFHEHHSFGDNLMNRDIPNYMLQNVRRWANLITSFLIIAFIWWKYDSDNAEVDAEISICESRGYYGGMLFSITFGYILSLVRITGWNCWNYVRHPILEEVITCLLLVLITLSAIWLLVKRRIIVFPIVAILAVVALHFFSANFLGVILFKHFPSNEVAYWHGPFFDSVANVCDWALFLAAFILYRKASKEIAVQSPET